jgi:hypothetical protein
MSSASSSSIIIQNAGRTSRCRPWAPSICGQIAQQTVRTIGAISACRRTRSGRRSVMRLAGTCPLTAGHSWYKKMNSTLPPSSRGLGRRVLSPITGVRIPVGVVPLLPSCRIRQQTPAKAGVFLALPVVLRTWASVRCLQDMGANQAAHDRAPRGARPSVLP